MTITQVRIYLACAALGVTPDDFDAAIDTFRALTFAHINFYGDQS